MRGTMRPLDADDKESKKVICIANALKLHCPVFCMADDHE